MNIQEAINKIIDYPAIPVYYDDNLETCRAVVKACYEGGIRLFEFVNRGTKAPENFEALLKLKSSLPELSLGIGTIKTASEAKLYLEMGADFIVSPVFNPDIAPLTLQRDILWIPGCMTPTEVHQAEAAGAPLVKLFPGSSLGPEFLKAIKPLFPGMRFMPTGGVSTEEANLKQWFTAGVTAVGMGSQLFKAPEAAVGFDWLSQRASELMKRVQALKAIQ